MDWLLDTEGCKRRLYFLDESEMRPVLFTLCYILDYSVWKYRLLKIQHMNWNAAYVKEVHVHEGLCHMCGPQADNILLEWFLFQNSFSGQVNMSTVMLILTRWRRHPVSPSPDSDIVNISSHFKYNICISVQQPRNKMLLLVSRYQLCFSSHHNTMHTEMSWRCEMKWKKLTSYNILRFR